MPDPAALDATLRRFPRLLAGEPITATRLDLIRLEYRLVVAERAGLLPGAASSVLPGDAA